MGRLYYLAIYFVILCASYDDPMREIIFENGINYPRPIHTRRIGKPRANWLIETYKDAWWIIDAQSIWHWEQSSSEHLSCQRNPFSNRRAWIAWYGVLTVKIVIGFVTEYVHRIFQRLWARRFFFPLYCSASFDIWTADSIGIFCSSIFGQHQSL